MGNLLGLGLVREGRGLSALSSLMRRRQSRVCVGGWGGRQEQPASLDREKSGWDRKDVAQNREGRLPIL